MEALQIVWQEMKKIFRPAMLLILLLINILMYTIFIEFNITYFPNGRPALDIYHIGIEMIEDYGQEMDEKEFAHFKTRLEEEKQKADEYLQSSEEWTAAGITSYQQFQETRREDGSPHDELTNKLFFEEGNNLFWEIPEREEIIERWEHIHDRYGYVDVFVPPTSRQEHRIREVVDSGDVHSIFPFYPVEENFHETSKNIAITVLVSVLFMISPIFIRDEKNQLVGLQYSSKIGRTLFKRKLAAGLLSAFILTSTLLAVYYSIYATNGIGMFLESGVNSFMGRLYWYDFTFIGLILVSILLTYVIILAMTLLAMYISAVCKNYISVIGVQLPIYVLISTFILRGMLLGEAFLLHRNQWLVGMLYGMIVLLPLLLVFWQWRKAKKADIMF
jgi:hypothetical protein